MWSGLAWLGRVATLGLWHSEESEHVSIFRKAAADALAPR
jgi:hypothetical protein